MRAIDIILDIVVLLVVLAAFMPFMPSAYHDMQDMSNWGFESGDDKTMQSYNGDPNSDGYISDTYSAAEILLTARVMDYRAIDAPDWILPDGQRITVDLDYNTNKGIYTAAVRGALSETEQYRFYFDYTMNVWRVIEA